MVAAPHMSIQLNGLERSSVAGSNEGGCKGLQTTPLLVIALCSLSCSVSGAVHDLCDPLAGLRPQWHSTARGTQGRQHGGQDKVIPLASYHQPIEYSRTSE